MLVSYPSTCACQPPLGAIDPAAVWMLRTSRVLRVRAVLSQAQVVIMVVDQQQRPELPEDAALLPGPPLRSMPAYVQLMHACWATDPAARPSFEGVIAQLRCCPNSVVLKFGIRQRVTTL